MSVQTDALGAEWKARLGLAFRKPPELYEGTSELRTSGHADAIRVALDDLGLTAIFCVQGTPAAAILRTDSYDAEKIRQLHSALWNQGLANVLVLITGDVLRIFSLGRNPIKGPQREFEKRNLIAVLDAATQALEIESLFTGIESGRIIEENKSYFRSSERVDEVILDNLWFAYKYLTERDVQDDAAQALLLQTMFIGYLEDRSVIGSSYLLASSRSKHENFASLLRAGDRASLFQLFRALRDDFNGNLFVAPSSLERFESGFALGKDEMSLLADFREGRVELRNEGSQWRFWGYDFRYIPVELISAVYDRFIGENNAGRRDFGAFYTPMFLADSVVSNAWDLISPDQEKAGHFLDPACGSGVFLVTVFQRLCSFWRESRSRRSIPWGELVRIAQRVHGWDIERGAVRVALFSIYLALLEEVDPPDLKELIAQGRRLPELWGLTLRSKDFFFDDDLLDYENKKFDVIIGNPPWTSRRAHNRRSIVWSRRHGVPMPHHEDAWAFTWKSLAMLREGGLCALLLPAMGFLHNNSEVSVEARQRLFSVTRVLRVVNFADLRFLLFDAAIRPATLVLIAPKETRGTAYSFDYWSPKADLNVTLRRSITMSSVDRDRISAESVIQNPLIFKHRLWLRGPEARLFRYLSSLPSLAALISPFRDVRDTTLATNSKRWIVGQGYQPAKADRLDDEDYRYFPSEYVGVLPDLPIQQFQRFWQGSDHLRARESNLVRRAGFEAGFFGPRILIPRGVGTARMRMRAAFANEPFTVQDIFQVIRVPPAEERRAKVLVALLNSSLAIWYAFHGTASFGSERPEVKLGELLTFPFPSPGDVNDEGRARKAEEGLIQLIEEASPNHGNLLVSPSVVTDLESRLDDLVFEYFGLSADERVLIEDGTKFLIPSAQPSRGSLKAAWRSATEQDRAAYVETILNSLRDWFADGTSFNARLEARNPDVAILSICFARDERGGLYSETHNELISKSLARLSAATNIPLGGNVHLRPDIRLFEGPCVYLIKPTQMRFWLRSQALADADAIASDIQQNLDKRVG